MECAGYVMANKYICTSGASEVLRQCAL